MELDTIPRSVVIGALGSRVLIGAGAISYLQIQGRLDLVSKWQGFGSGSILCFLLSIGVTYEELIDDICSLGLSEWVPFQFTLVSPNWITIRKVLEQRLQTRFPQYHLDHLTLSKLYSTTRMILDLKVFNTTTGELEFFNHETKPDLHCLEAVFASIATPGILPAYVINGCSYQDPTFLYSIRMEPIADELVIGSRYPYSSKDEIIPFPSVEETLLGLIGSLTQNRCIYPEKSLLVDHLESVNLEIDLQQGWKWIEQYFTC
jgi:hypothetical protein